MVRLRNWAATSRQRPRSDSMSLMVLALRKLIRFFGLLGLWQAEQFCARTGRMDWANSSGEGCCGEAAAVRTNVVTKRSREGGEGIALFTISGTAQSEGGLTTVYFASWAANRGRSRFPGGGTGWKAGPQARMPNATKLRASFVFSRLQAPRCDRRFRVSTFFEDEQAKPPVPPEHKALVIDGFITRRSKLSGIRQGCLPHVGQ